MKRKRPAGAGHASGPPRARKGIAVGAWRRGWRRARVPGSERDVVVREGLVVARRRRRPLVTATAAATRFAAAGAGRAIAATGAHRPVPALAATAEHLHLVGDDLGDVALLAVLAGELVVADRAFDVDLAALAQVLAGDLAELAEQLDAVPFGALLGVAVTVLAHAGGGQAERGHGHAALGVLHVGVIAQVAHQDDLVHASGHCFRVLEEIGLRRTAGVAAEPPLANSGPGQAGRSRGPPTRIRAKAGRWAGSLYSAPCPTPSTVPPPVFPRSRPSPPPTWPRSTP